MSATAPAPTVLAPRTRRGRRTGPLIRRVPGAVITLVLGLVVIALLAILGARLAGYQALVVRSGSMGDAIPTGSLALMGERPRAAVALGDVVVVDPPGPAQPRLHRVVERRPRGREVLVRTQGDANPTADVGVIALPPTVPMPVLILPGVGYVLAATSSRAGVLITAGMGVAIVGLSLLWAYRRRP